MRAFTETLFRSMFALACAMLPSIAAGQQAPEVPTSETVLRVSTRLVLVDTVVVDKAGKPITNLTQRDFSIWENGKPQKIAAFSVHQPVQGKSQPPILEPHVTSNRPDVLQMQGTVGVLLLDALNTPRRNQVFVRQQMQKFLAEHFDPAYRIAVFALTDKLVVLQDFTSDPALLKAALDRYVPQVPLLAHNAVSTLDIPGAEMAIRADEKEDEVKRPQRVRATVGALQNIARYMAGQPGRKVLLWFSEGFPISVGGKQSGHNQIEAMNMNRLINRDDPITESYLDPFDGMGESREYSDQIRRTTNLLNDTHIAIYAIDAHGLSTSSLFDSTSRGLDEGSRLRLGTDINGALAQETFQRASAEDSLEQAAVDTGGQYFHNRNDLDRAIDLSLQESGSYYMLGYYPSEKKWDGKFRQIRVSIDRAGARVLHRRGYFAVNPEDWRKGGHDKDFSASLAHAPLPSTQVLFMARALPPKRDADVKVEFLLDPTTILFRTAQERPSCNLNFEVQAFTPEGKLVKAVVESAEAPLRPETFTRVQKHGLSMQVPIKLPVGRYKLRLGVRDNLTGLFGTAELPIEVSATAQEPMENFRLVP